MNGATQQAIDVLRARGVVGAVDTAIVLGSGLGGLADAAENPTVVPYAELPGFPVSRAPSHEGRLLIGRQEGLNVCYFQGRGHFYDAGDPGCMSAPLATAKALGAKQVILTSAVGSVRSDFYPGNLVMVTDHINLSGLNPLIGVIDRTSYVNLVDAYDPRLIRRFKRAAAGAGVSVHEGVYMWFPGPSFETPAEIKLARTLGADLVGMSVTSEAILARRLGMRVAAITVVTNFGAGFQGGNPDHAETLKQAQAGAIGLRRLIRGFLKTPEGISL